MKLMDFVNKKEGDLDALIAAHRQYIGNTTKKILLWNNKPGKEVCIFLPISSANSSDCGIGECPSPGSRVVRDHPAIPDRNGNI